MSADNLSDRIKSDLVTGMKSGNSLMVSVLRMLLSEMNYKKIDLGRELTDVDIISVLQREVKKRREAIESYTQAGRAQQADTEKEELKMLEAYLPAQLSPLEIRAEVGECLKEIDSREFGQVMKVVSPRFRGRADGAVVASIVKELISS